MSRTNQARVLRHGVTPGDLTLPHNLDAERSVLGALLVDNAHLPVVGGILDSSDFFRDAHQRIYRAMAALHARQSVIDTITLKDELSRCSELDEVGGPAYVSSLANGMPRSVNVSYYAAIVRDYARLRDVIVTTKRLETCAYERDVEGIEKAFKAVQSATANVTLPRGISPSLTEKNERGRRVPVTLDDIGVIEDVIARANANFLVIDPVNAFMTGDSYNDVEVRRRLAPLVSMARARDVAVMGLMHMTKDTKRSVLHRTLGSVGFTGTARMVLELAADVMSTDRKRRLLITHKNNLSPDKSALAYTFTRGKMVWEPGNQTVDYDSLAAGQAKDTPEQLTAVEFLRALMDDARETWPLRAKETVRKAVEIGISASALNRAKKQLGVTAKRNGFNDNAEWRWYRPRRARKGGA